MYSNSIWTIIVLIVLLIIVLKSRPFKVWWMGRNKTDEQKKAIKFLIYGPSRSKITKDEYDVISNGMYSDKTILEKAKSKLGITDSDIVRHPCKDIDSTYLSERNYLKNGEKILFFDLGINEFRSSRMDCLMVIFGREKLYFYEFSYRTNKTEETEKAYSYSYDDIRVFKVAPISSKNDSIYASIELQKEVPEEDAKNEQKRKGAWQSFPSMVMAKENFERWKAVGEHLDYPELKKAYKDLSENEKKALRYFKAYDFLPLSITDQDYDMMINQALPSEELRTQGMNNMDIKEKDIRFAEPITFRSFVYGANSLDIKGKDEAWRSNSPQHTWIFFGEHQIYVHTVTINMVTSVKQEATQEIFYNDITSVRTEERSLEKKRGDLTIYLSYYQFTVMFSGDNLTLTLPIMSDDNDRKIHAMRNLLRKKKQSKGPEEQSADNEDMV